MTYRRSQSVAKYAHLAEFEEIKDNDFNLNIPRYVSTSEEEAEVDLAAVQTEIAAVDAQLAMVSAKISEYLRELRE